MTSFASAGPSPPPPPPPPRSAPARRPPPPRSLRGDQPLRDPELRHRRRPHALPQVPSPPLTLVSGRIVGHFGAATQQTPVVSTAAAVVVYTTHASGDWTRAVRSSTTS